MLMKTILIKLADKYNIPYDIMYIILEKYHKNNINESIKKKKFNLRKTILFNPRSRYREKTNYNYLMEKISFNKFRYYDVEILKKLVYEKNKYLTESSNKSFMSYFILLYETSGWRNLPYRIRGNMEYAKYIL